MIDIKSLWNHMKEIGFVVNSNNCNGLKMWQPLKKFYTNCQYDECKEIKIDKEIKQLTSLIKYSSNDSDDESATIKIGNTTLKNTKQADHFVIQHFRIAKLHNYKLPLVKLLQIAYNAGQVESEIAKQTYSDEVVEFYKSNNLGYINTFVNNKDTKAVVKRIARIRKTHRS